jgi:hypothetical protein
MNQNSSSEYERQKRVLNMMITAHSALRDRYFGISRFYDIILIIASVFLNAVVFANDSFYFYFFDKPSSGKLTLGIISAFVFALSLIGILLNTKQKSENHKQASIQLSNLLNESRIIDDIAEDIERNNKISVFIRKYDQITSILVAIPNKKFNRLKSRHLRKVEFSKFISQNPSSLFFIQKIQFCFFKKNRNGK